MESATWLGADPGGRDSFGVAALSSDGSATAGVVSCVDEAVEWLLEASGGAEPLGLGVDAPLWWSSGRSAERAADRWIRATYGIASGTVQTANSLRGAAVVQGPMLVHRMRGRFPEAKVTETHPKALLLALGVQWADIALEHRVGATLASEHERDALISALCAREGFMHRWRHDLAARRDKSEQDPGAHWLGPVHYFWPETEQGRDYRRRLALFNEWERQLGKALWALCVASLGQVGRFEWDNDPQHSVVKVKLASNELGRDWMAIHLRKNKGLWVEIVGGELVGEAEWYDLTNPQGEKSGMRWMQIRPTAVPTAHDTQVLIEMLRTVHTQMTSGNPGV